MWGLLNAFILVWNQSRYFVKCASPLLFFLFFFFFIPKFAFSDPVLAPCLACQGWSENSDTHRGSIYLLHYLWGIFFFPSQNFLFHFKNAGLHKICELVLLRNKRTKRQICIVQLRVLAYCQLLVPNTIHKDKNTPWAAAVALAVACAGNCASVSVLSIFKLKGTFMKKRNVDKHLT